MWSLKIVILLLISFLILKIRKEKVIIFVKSYIAKKFKRALKDSWIRFYKFFKKVKTSLDIESNGQ